MVISRARHLQGNRQLLFLLIGEGTESDKYCYCAMRFNTLQSEWRPGIPVFRSRVYVEDLEIPTHFMSAPNTPGFWLPASFSAAADFAPPFHLILQLGNLLNKLRSARCEAMISARHLRRLNDPTRIVLRKVVAACPSPFELCDYNIYLIQHDSPTNGTQSKKPLWSTYIISSPRLQRCGDRRTV